MPANPGIKAPVRTSTHWLLPGLAALLSACASAPESPYPATAPEQPSAAVRATTTQPTLIPPDARVLEVNPKLTRIHIKVYRAGRLAHLGHNHVITAHGVTGRIWSHENMQHSGFELSIPVAHMVVDDPAARAAAGDAFDRPVNSQDTAATRANLLGEKVLDAARFPSIDISAGAISGTAPNLEATILVTLKGVTSHLEAAVRVAVSDQQLVASGTLPVSQRSVNITPYSALGGALRVRDEIDIEYSIVADRQAE